MAGELESIRVFLAVVEQGSFIGAARHLGMTAASVTRTVATLEDRLGVQLLVRTTRQVSPTSAGSHYAARVAPLCRELATAREETREAHGITSGVVRVAAPMSLGLKVLPTVLSQFAALHPRTHVAVDLSDRFIDIVEEDFDLAIRISAPPASKSTIWRKIAPVPRILVASPACLTARGTPRDPEDLADFACLGYQSDAREEIWELSRDGRRRTHRVQGAFSANNGDLLARLALNGEGIALLPRFIVEDEIAAGTLVEVLAGWETPRIWLTLYYPPYDRLPLRVATFSDFFEACVRDTCPL